MERGGGDGKRGLREAIGWWGKLRLKIKGEMNRGLNLIKWMNWMN